MVLKHTHLMPASTMIKLTLLWRRVGVKHANAEKAQLREQHPYGNPTHCPACNSTSVAHIRNSCLVDLDEVPGEETGGGNANYSCGHCKHKWQDESKKSTPAKK